MATAQAGTPGSPRERAIDTTIMIIGLLVIWQIFYEIAGDIAMAPPLATVRYTLDMLSQGDFWPNAYSTLHAFAIALVIEIVLGLVIGLFLGLRRVAGEVMEPLLAGLYSVPKIMFYPVILMICGIGETSEVTFGVIHGVIPIVMFTMNAVRAIRPVHLKTARVMNLSMVQVMTTIALRAAIPEVFTGLRIGFSATLIGVLLSEMFGSHAGIGYLLMGAIGNNQVSEIMSLALLMTLFAAIANGLLMAVDKRLHRRT